MRNYLFYVVKPSDASDYLKTIAVNALVFIGICMLLGVSDEMIIHFLPLQVFFTDLRYYKEQ